MAAHLITPATGAGIIAFGIPPTVARVLVNDVANPVRGERDVLRVNRVANVVFPASEMVTEIGRENRKPASNGM